MHPVAFHIGNLPIAWYGVLVALGFLAGLWTASRRAPRIGLSGELITDLGPWLIVSSILGARALYVASYWERNFAGKPFWESFAIHHGGLVFYGGLIGAVLGTVWFARRRRVALWPLADVLAPSVALGHVFGRLGCLMNGCCYGRECALAWAVRYPANPDLPPHPVHPTQVYEAVLNLGLYVALAALFRRRKFDGQVFAVYLIAYAVIRAFVEMFRGDYATRTFGVVTPAQWISGGLLIAGLVLWWKLPRTNRAKTR